MIPAAVELVVRTSLLLGVAWTVARQLERGGASAASRHAIWLSGFGALAVLPLCFLLIPAIPLRILPAEPMLPASGGLPAANAGAGPAGADSIHYLATLKTIYVVGVAVLLARIVAGQLLLARLWRRAGPLCVASHAAETARGVCSDLRIRRDVDIRLLEGVVPMTWGSLRPRLLLPQEAAGWTDDRLRSVLLHEFGHIARYDSLARVGAEVICSFYWPHPAVWLAARRMRLAQEQASDDLALNHGTPALAYARHLLASASSARGWRSALAMANSADLGLRLHAILEDTKRSTAGRPFLALAALLSLGLAASVSAIVPAPMAGLSGADVASAPVVRPAGNVSQSPVEAAPPIVTTMGLRAPAMWPGRRPTQTVMKRPQRGFGSSSDRAAEDEDYQARLARYGERVGRYNAELQSYRAELNDYSRASAEFIRKTRAYQDRMAKIGPDPPPDMVLPTYPTAPTAPTHPTAPTAPVKPVLPPALHDIH